MLDSFTKRRIDTCRDILVGKIPDPKSQVEQITIALIYKFMDDMDLESEELGGERKFFTGEFERYAWGKLVAPGTSGQDMLNTYGEALQRMTENEKLPALFRDIFRNAYLPYRDPETLRSFLREINGFTYDHSERLGDAFEYLLSVLGSQGDAGQFRTPRHIIDFMVEIIDPKKDEVILDPACGTAGFLISSYKHILKANSSAPDVDGNGESESAVERPIESPLRFAGDLLTGEDRQRLARNIKGYDISPDMVRLSLVNLYLHGFANPRVEEYDTLTSEDKWSEMADVVLANPPFMSPKGGIRPHNRFSIAATRSEVLFVDYIAEHLTPKGRAAVIVPEGVIFQSGSAYKTLRKMLVQNFLVAVISLPAGVFNPYSGVKTSILIFDRAAAKASDTVGLFKIVNDGFNLGAQRRPIGGSELPDVLAEIAEYRAHDGEKAWEGRYGRAVAKDDIAADGDFNLNGDRYGRGSGRASVYDLHQFDEICTLEYGAALPKEKRIDGPYPVVGSNGITGYHNTYLIEGPAIVVGRKGSAGEVCWVESNCFPIDTTYYVKLVDPEVVDLRYLYRILSSLDLPSLRGGAGIPGLNRSDVYAARQIPLPPIEVQRKIVAEIEGYQKVIDGARAVLENYRPHIPIDPAWPTRAIGDVCDLINGTAFKPSDWSSPENGGLPIVRIQNLNNPDALFNFFAGEIRERFLIEPGQLLFSWSGSRGTSFGAHIWRGEKAILNQHIFKVLFDKDEAVKEYLHHALNEAVEEVEENLHGGVGLVHITKGNLEKIEIPLPPLEIQHAIVAELEAERALVEASRQLIARMKAKIGAAIARVWGGAEHAAPEEVAA